MKLHTLHAVMADARNQFNLFCIVSEWTFVPFLKNPSWMDGQTIEGITDITKRNLD